MLLTIAQIKELYLPVFQKYNVQNVWLFGSYARNEARESSDVDFLYEESELLASDYKQSVALFDELTNVSEKSVDLIATVDLKEYMRELIDQINKEKVKLL